MEIEFKTQELLDYFQCRYSGKQPFSDMVLEGFRSVVTKMIEAENIVILSKFRSLNIEKYKDHWSARINKQFRIEFEFIKPNTIFILKISKHYE